MADLIGVAEHSSVGQMESAVRRLRSIDDNDDIDSTAGAAPLEYVSHS